MRKPVFLAAILSSFVGIAIARESFAKYEEPNFKVLMKEGPFEVREYPRVVSASVVVDGGGKRSANRAFKILGGYIFGKNKAHQKVAMTVPVTESIKSEKIAMTVPVITNQTDNEMTMSFFMPLKYTLDTLPEPVDERITFKTIQPRKFAVVRFSGTGSEKSCRKEEQDLLHWLKQRQLPAGTEPIRAFYNPPWTLPFLRRNEIWIELQ